MFLTKVGAKTGYGADSSHIVLTRDKGNNIMRVVLFSPENSLFAQDGESLVDMEYTGDIDKVKDLSVSGIIASDPQGNSYNLTYSGQNVETGIDDNVIEDTLSVMPMHGAIIVNGAKGKLIRVVMSDGTMYYHSMVKSECETITLPKGFYIIYIEDESIKVLIE